MDGGDVSVASHSTPPGRSAKQQLFSFLSRRTRNQIEPGVVAYPEEDPEVPHVEDLFQSPEPPSNIVVANNTTAVKRSFLQPRGPFALCCTADGRAMTPVIVRYNNTNNNSTTSRSGTIRPPPRRSHSNYKDNLAYESHEVDRRFYSPPPPPIAEENERPRSRKIQVQPCDEEAVDKLNALKSSPNYSSATFDNRPGYAEYYQQNTYNSIAMSACKSRLREKLLPPPLEHKVSMNGNGVRGEDPDIYSVTSDVEEGTSHNSSNNMNVNNRSSSSNKDPNHNHSENKVSSPLPVHHCENGGSHSQRPASTDSLARQALMAAQVLHLIPTEKARARSIAHNSNICNNTLLGTSELNKVLPNREIKIFVGTWNMNGEPPPR